jgi:hypothetical protein
MAARIVVIDAGSVARTVTRFSVVDSGGTTRIIQRGFVIDAGSTARLIYSRGYAGSLTAGLGNPGAGNPFIGYNDASDGNPVYGSLSPTASFIGTVSQITDSYLDLGGGPFYVATQLLITGLSSDPGAAAFTTLTIGASSLLASGASYSYSAPQATWIWNSGPYFSNGSTYSIAIT